MKNFRELDVWNKAHKLTLEIYQLTSGFPATERFGLRTQLQRAASSIGANLAEGCGRDTDADFRRFAQIACGSACEVEYHLLLAHDLGLLETHAYQALNTKINEVIRMLYGLIRFLNNRNPKTTRSPR